MLTQSARDLINTAANNLSYKPTIAYGSSLNSVLSKNLIVGGLQTVNAFVDNASAVTLPSQNIDIAYERKLYKKIYGLVYSTLPYCFKCLVYGLSISGGFTVPAGTDPNDENFTGAGISAGSCEDYYDQCTAASAAYGDPAGFECSVPYWTFTFNGQAFPPGIDNILGAGGDGSTYIEGQGCENIPQIISDLIELAKEADSLECIDLAQANYGINIIGDSNSVVIYNENLDTLLDLAENHPICKIFHFLEEIE